MGHRADGLYYGHLEAKRCTVEAAAVIVDVTEEVHSSYNRHRAERRTYYYPTIEFSTPEKTVRVRINYRAFHPDTYIKGEKLNTLYNPQNPYDLKLKRGSLWEGAAGMGLFFLLGAVFLYVCMRVS